METKNIPLNLIQFETDFQARAAMSGDVVAEYAEAMKDGAHFPPVLVYFDGKLYYLADGYHRTAAALRLDRTEIQAKVHIGTRRDAMLYAIGANSNHGLRRSREDKRRAVTMLLMDEEWRQWSDREISRKARVDHKTVGKIRKELVEAGEIPSDDVRKTADGKVMDTTNIGNGARAEDGSYSPGFVAGVKVRHMSSGRVGSIINANPSDTRIHVRFHDDGKLEYWKRNGFEVTEEHHFQVGDTVRIDGISATVSGFKDVHGDVFGQIQVTKPNPGNGGATNVTTTMKAETFIPKLSHLPSPSDVVRGTVPAPGPDVRPMAEAANLSPKSYILLMTIHEHGRFIPNDAHPATIHTVISKGFAVKDDDGVMSLTETGRALFEDQSDESDDTNYDDDSRLAHFGSIADGQERAAINVSDYPDRSWKKRYHDIKRDHALRKVLLVHLGAGHLIAIGAEADLLNKYILRDENLQKNENISVHMATTAGTVVYLQGFSQLFWITDRGEAPIWYDEEIGYGWHDLKRFVVDLCADKKSDYEPKVNDVVENRIGKTGTVKSVAGRLVEVHYGYYASKYYAHELELISRPEPDIAQPGLPLRIKIEEGRADDGAVHRGVMIARELDEYKGDTVEEAYSALSDLMAWFEITYWDAKGHDMPFPPEEAPQQIQRVVGALTELLEELEAPASGPDALLADTQTTIKE